MLEDDNDKIYIQAPELAEKLVISKSKAYELIRIINKELAEKGHLVIRGHAPRKYLYKRLAVLFKDDI